MSNVWAKFDDVADIDWLLIGGEHFTVRAGTFSIEDGWASWIAENGTSYGAPVVQIQAVSYQ